MGAGRVVCPVRRRPTRRIVQRPSGTRQVRRPEASIFAVRSTTFAGSTHFSGGTKVTLQYAVDWDYKACPFCNPPTSIVPDMDS